MNILLILITVFTILILVRLMSISQLSVQLAGEDEDAEVLRDNKINSLLSFILMIVGLVAIGYMTLRYSKFILPVAASEHGVIIDQLLWINFAIIGLVFVLTQIALFYFVWRYQYRPGEKAYYFPHSNKLEMIWTIIPAIVLMGLIITGLRVWNQVTMGDRKGGMLIQVYGKQFDWTARYAGKDNTLGASNFRLIADNNELGVDMSDNAAADDIIMKEIYLPADQPVMMEFNSRDVIHSAYLPHFRTQMNCVPGMTTNFYFKPTITTAKMREITGKPEFDYVLLCNKICGVAHYNMKMKVVVVSKEEFIQWIQSGKKLNDTMNSLASADVESTGSSTTVILP